MTIGSPAAVEMGGATRDRAALDAGLARTASLGTQVAVHGVGAGP
jgi:hypothetical protein